VQCSWVTGNHCSWISISWSFQDKLHVDQDIRFLLWEEPKDHLNSLL
jgi:hypothetical protein